MNISKSKEEVNYSSAENIISTTNNMNNMRKQQVLCDLNIKIGAKVMAVHKIVLASNSEYFNKMFTSDFKESSENEITINEVEPDALEHLVEYAYTSKLKITEQNVQGLLVASNFLLYFDHNIYTECLKFIKNIVNTGNCFKFKDFACLNDIGELQEFCNSFILDNFGAISISRQFLSLSLDQILELIQSEYINACQVKIYESIILWVKHDFNNRSNSIQKLMKHIRMSLIPVSYFMDHIENEEILNANCKDFLYEALKLYSSKHAKCSMSSANRFYNLGRNCSSDQLILIISWDLYTFKCSINYLSTKDDKLFPVNSTHLKIRDVHILSDGRVLGTSIFNYTSNRHLMYYDERIEKWVDNFPTHYYNIEFVELNNHLYTLLGPTNDFISFDMTGNDLTPVHKSSPGRFGRLVQSDEFIYCVSNGKSGCEMYQYNPITDVWLNIWHANDFINYTYSTLCYLNGFIYMFGGKFDDDDDDYDGPYGSLCSASKFNISTRVWNRIADMNVGRADAGAVAVNGLIYVIGGCKCNSIEIYDPQTKIWTLSKHKIDSTTYGKAIAIILNPESNINAENIYDYYSNI